MKFEIDGEIIYAGAPDPEDILDGGPMDPADIDPESKSPESWRYVTDVFDEETFRYLIARAKRHPEDEYLQGRMDTIWIVNHQHHEKTGRYYPGYDEEYFANRPIPESYRNKEQVPESEEGA